VPFDSGFDQAEQRQARLREAFRRYDEANQQALEAEQAREELQEALYAAAAEWLEEKWGTHRPCPYCGNKEWTVSTPFNILLESRNTLPPHFSAICTNCAHTTLINAVAAGLFPEPELEHE
jgi:hypothetical protein